MSHCILAKALLLAAAATPAAAAATDWVGDRHVAVRLITAADAASSSPSIEAGVQFRFAPGWHGYWRTPGDSGIAPVMNWSATPRLVSASVDWPAPRRLVVEGLQNATYDGTVVLPVALTLADPDAPAAINVAVDYAACSNVCVPFHADLALALPHGAGGGSPEAAAIAEARSRVPGSPAAAGIDVVRQVLVGAGRDRTLVLTLRSEAAPFVQPDLFVEHAGDGLPPAPAIRREEGGRTVTLTVRIPDDAAAPLAAPLVVTVVDGNRAATFPGPPPAPLARQDDDLRAVSGKAPAAGAVP